MRTEILGDLKSDPDDDDNVFQTEKFYDGKDQIKNPEINSKVQCYFIRVNSQLRFI